MPKIAANPYDEKFFVDQTDGSRRSAGKVVPWMLRWLTCKSVVDFGCGLGTWLSAFACEGVTDICGVDGEYVDLQRLAFDSSRFVVGDLTKPIDLGRKFELAISLEVGEHLPADAADNLVETLCRHSDIVLFSAATPHQSGTNHINLQWPAYWSERFRSRGYLCSDCIRPQFWEDSEVEWWYSQNAILYLKEVALPRAGGPAISLAGNRDPLPLVHPELLAHVARQVEWALQEEADVGLRSVLQRLPGAAKRSLLHRLDVK